MGRGTFVRQFMDCRFNGSPKFGRRLPLTLWPHVYSILRPASGILGTLKMTGTKQDPSADARYSSGALTRRLCALAWEFRADCLWSVALSLGLLLLGIAGLQFLGLVIDVIRQALNPALPPPSYPLGWHPPPGWTPFHIVSVLALAIVAQALLRACLTYAYNMVTARLTQGEIVPRLRAAALRQTPAPQLQLLRRPRLQLHLQPRHRRRPEHPPLRGRRPFAGHQHDPHPRRLRLLHVAHPPSLTVACLSVSIAALGAGPFYSARLRPGYLRNRELTDQMVLLFSESVRGMQTVKGFAAEAAPSPPVRGCQRSGLRATAPHLSGTCPSSPPAPRSSRN